MRTYTNKMLNMFNGSNNNKQLIAKKQKANKLKKHEFNVRTVTNETFAKERFAYDWVWVTDGYYEWQIILEQFNINHIPNFEWKIVSKTDVDIEDLEILSNGYFVLEDKTSVVQKVLFNLSVFTESNIQVKPMIVYHGLNKKSTLQNVGYEMLGGGGVVAG